MIDCCCAKYLAQTTITEMKPNTTLPEPLCSYGQSGKTPIMKAQSKGTEVMDKLVKYGYQKGTKGEYLSTLLNKYRR